MQSISKMRQAIIDQLRRGVPNVSADSIDANAVETKRVNNRISASQIGSLSDAINEANAGDVVIVDDDFSEDVTIDKAIGLVGGAVSVGGFAEGTVTVDSDDVTIHRLFIASGEGTLVVNDANRVSVIGCKLSSGDIEIGGNDTRFIGNRTSNEDITLTSDSQRCVVVANASLGTVTDNGSNNQVSNNT